MNVYDFDGTIYDGDSGIDFLKYSFRKKPFILIIVIIKTFLIYIKYLFNKATFQEVKESMFSFVSRIKDFDKFINKFVLKHKKKIKKFYLDQKSKNDLIITASLDFYVKPLCHSVGIKKIIATKYDVKKGKIIGNNCKGSEKVKILLRMYPNKRIDKFYTDSISDEPLFNHASEVYIVEKTKIFTYTQKFQFKKKVFDKKFLIFVFCGGMGTLTNFVFSSIFATKIDPVISYIGGYAISLIVSYLLNIKLVFKRRINVYDFIKFVVSYIPNFVILLTFVYVFINVLLLNKYVVYLLAAIIGLPITYAILKLFTFKKK